MKFYIVDAFSSLIFGGNTAGVVLIEDDKDFPKEDIMIKIASELRYSETAFVKKTGNNKFHIRYFTPTNEVDLCGHATIASFGVLLREEIVSEDDEAIINTKAGELLVEFEDSQIFMEMGKAKELSEIKDKDSLANCLGVKAEDIILTPTIVSTGLADIIVGIKTKEVLLAMKPNFKEMTKFSDLNNVVGIHAFSLSGDSNITAYCRNFAPLFGIDEESATGTANGALTYYLYNRGIIKPKTTNIFIQGESMGRPSIIMSVITDEEAMRIIVGGKAFVVAQGELYI